MTLTRIVLSLMNSGLLMVVICGACLATYFFAWEMFERGQNGKAKTAGVVFCATAGFPAALFLVAFVLGLGVIHLVIAVMWGWVSVHYGRKLMRVKRA